MGKNIDKETLISTEFLKNDIWQHSSFKVSSFYINRIEETAIEGFPPLEKLLLLLSSKRKSREIQKALTPI